MDTSWTPERTALLEELWAAGSTARQIADQLRDTTRNAVIGKARRIGLAERAPSPHRNISGRPKSDQPKTKRKYVQQVFVHGRHRHVKEVVLREPVVEIVDSEIPSWQRRHLLELGQYHCRYPVGEVGQPGFFFCGAPKKEGSPYCLPHHQRCHTKERAGRWFSFAKLF